MTENIQSPKSIVAGLSEFGGILAALRGMMIVMLLINRRQFEKKVTKFLQKEKAKAEDTQETSAPAVIRRARSNLNKR